VLPCFWGIAPGATSAEAAWELLLALGAQGYGEDLDGPTVGRGIGFFVVDQADVGVTTIERDGIIQSIDVYAEDFDNPFSLQFDWETYSLSNVLATYGQPSRAFLEAVAVPTVDQESRRYGLWIYYDEMGFAIRYSGLASVVEGAVRICPGWAGPGGMGAIRLMLLAPGAATPLEALSGYTADQLQAVWPLEEVSGLTAEQLHEVYAGSEGIDCFEMPLADRE
jgi:hypothetical protein